MGLGRVEAAARVLALERFEEVAGTEGFMRMDEEAVGSLLDDDALRASREEAVLEAVVGWMKGGEGELRGRGLLSRIRFCVLGFEYLTLLWMCISFFQQSMRTGSTGRKFVGHGRACGGSDTGQVASGGFKATRME